MKKLIVLLFALFTMACRPEVLPGSPGKAQSSSVVVLGLVDGGTYAEWIPLCGGVVTAPSEVTTSLDCVVPKNGASANIVQLAVADFETWLRTSGGQQPALLSGSDFDKRIARLRTYRPMTGARVAIPAAHGFADGDQAIVARTPDADRVEKAVVMASAHDGRGLISSKQDSCRDLIAGAGVYNTGGELVGIVTKGGLTFSEYTAVSP